MRWVVYAAGRPIAEGVLTDDVDADLAAVNLLAAHAVYTGLSLPDMRALTCVVTGPSGESMADGRDW